MGISDKDGFNFRDKDNISIVWTVNYVSKSYCEPDLRPIAPRQEKHLYQFTSDDRETITIELPYPPVYVNDHIDQLIDLFYKRMQQEQ